MLYVVRCAERECLPAEYTEKSVDISNFRVNVLTFIEYVIL